jgi:RimJ/RimL family protein N-acetyltransferase
MTRDDEVLKWTFVPSEWSEDLAAEAIVRDNELWAGGSGESLKLAITLDDDPVGVIGLKLSRRHAHGETFYFLDANARGRGIATAALDSVCRWAFGTLAMKRIQLFVDPANYRSIALAERCRFQREGLLRSHLTVKSRRQDSLLYARLPSD